MLARIVLCGVLSASGTLALAVVDHPAHRSVARMSPEELQLYQRQITVVGSQPLPPDITDRSSRVVNDEDHPFIAPTSSDKRGPCPGTNVLANHGWVPRSGVMTPAQLIVGSMEGFNMDYKDALGATYAVHLTAGNQLTNLLSIGDYSPATGPVPAPPAINGGYAQHNAFEGDASLTRSDANLGDHSTNNATLFNELVAAMDDVSGGLFTAASAAVARIRRIQHSIANNAKFTYNQPRWLFSIGESGNLFGMMSNQTSPETGPGVPASAFSEMFLQGRMPEGYIRREGAWKGDDFSIAQLAAANGTFPTPGQNDGTNTNSYTLDPRWNATNLPSSCDLYDAVVAQTVALYPSPRGDLRRALIGNLKHLHFGFTSDAQPCTELKPYGDA